MTTIPINLAAPVERFALGDIVTWDIGRAKPLLAEVIRISARDSLHCSDKGAGYFPGTDRYLGRLLFARCFNLSCTACHAHPLGEPCFHSANECQLTRAAAPFVEVALF